MKLELKHICAYLPYDLECKAMGFTDTIFDVRGASDGFLELSELESVISDQWDYVEAFPLLRPMSDLIKPITHNGKTFVPAQVLWSVDIGEEETFETYGTIPEYWKTCCESELKHHAWGDVQKLLEWRFDVFKLIPNGLAIAIK